MHVKSISLIITPLIDLKRQYHIIIHIYRTSRNNEAAM